MIWMLRRGGALGSALAVLAAGSVLVLAPPSARADSAAENFITENINDLLGMLDEIDTSSASLDAFENRLREVVDIGFISRFVLGRYGRGIDRAMFARYSDSYQAYLRNFYLARLQNYAGDETEFEVTGSVDLKRASIVKSKIVVGDGPPAYISWRVRPGRDGIFRIQDLGFVIEGNQLWLAQEQRAQFQAVLDRSNGDIEVLIAQLEKQNAIN